MRSGMFEKIVQVAILGSCLFIAYTLKFGNPVTKPTSSIKAVELPTDLPLYNTRGDIAAKKVVVIVSDYECPFCSKLLDSDLYKAIDKGIQLHRIKQYDANFPLVSLHKNAKKAAEASLCGADAGKFWELDAAMHTNYSSLTPDKLTTFAGDVGMKVPEFRKCLDSGAKTKLIEQQSKIWENLGVTGTPTVILAREDGDKLKGTMFPAGPPAVNDFQRWMNK